MSDTIVALSAPRAPWRVAQWAVTRFQLQACSKWATTTPWMTTSNLSLESQASVPVSANSFTYLLPAMSVVTFVGEATPALYITSSGGTVTIYWQNVPGWNLYQNSDLATPGGWSINTNATTTNGTNYLYVTPPTGNLFYRLSNP